MSKPERVWPSQTPASPVDYGAWRRGYMPPSEHMLIHALQFEDARVAASMNFNGSTWWFVHGGDMTPKLLRSCIASLNATLRFLEEDEKASAQRPDEEHSDTAPPNGTEAE